MNIGDHRTYADGDYVVVSSETRGYSTVLRLEPYPPTDERKGFTVNVHVAGD